MGVTENNLAELVVGAYGWEHEQWLESYYPDDLPEDWRLDYYANEFDCVILPAKVWMSIDVDMIQQWLDEVEENFMFFIELTEYKPALKERLSLFNGHCNGAILQDGKAQDWQDILGDIPLLQSDDKTLLKRYQTAQSVPVLVWLQLEAGETIDVAALREHIESALEGIDAASQIAFIVGNEAPVMGNLQNAKVLAELLGA